MDPNEHEHPEGFPEHNHPHDTTYHMDFSGLTGEGKGTGHAELDVPGAQSAIIGEPPKGPAGVVAEGGGVTLSSIPLPKRFFINRLIDESGVSGIGPVAVGVQWPTGKCSIEWIVEPHTWGGYDSIDDVIKVHGHNGKTVVQWLADKTVLE